MLEFFTTGPDDAINILKKDHDTVKALFDDFEKAETLAQKKKIVAQAIMELKIHATIEEELFYSSLRGKQDVDQDLLNESDEEHHVAKLLIAELEQMDGHEDHYDAKFTVLSENIKHHVKEEEGDLFPQARKTEVDFTELGQKLLARKEQLTKNGIPACAEEVMIFSHRKGSGDSPAKAAQKKSPAKRKSAKSKASKPVAKKAAAKKPAAKKTTAKKTGAKAKVLKLPVKRSKAKSAKSAKKPARAKAKPQRYAAKSKRR